MAPKMLISPLSNQPKSTTLNFFLGKWREAMKAILGIRTLIVVFTALVLAGVASADTVYTYAGNTIPGCNCAIDGSVTLAAPVVSSNIFDEHVVLPLSFSFTADGFIFTPTDSTVTFIFSTVNGQIGLWHVNGSAPGGQYFFTSFAGSAFEATDGTGNSTLSQFNSLEGNRGTWTTDSAAVAEPATGLLLSIGLAFAGLMRRRKKKVAEDTVWESLG
jgi:hypothetical protein